MLELPLKADLELLLKFFDHECTRTCKKAELLSEEVQIDKFIVLRLTVHFLFEFRLLDILLHILSQYLNFVANAVLEGFEFTEQLVDFSYLNIV